MALLLKRSINMSEVELVLVNDTDKCTIYTIQFSEESETEYERFYSKFIENAQLNRDLLRIVQLLDKIAEEGALERFFRLKVKCEILLSLFLCFAQNSVYTVCVSLTGFSFSAMEESKIREHTRKMTRCVDMS